MKLTVVYFAAARERAGTSAEPLSFPGPMTVAALLTGLQARHPALTALLPLLRSAVNHEFAALEDLVPDGAEVALIPPVAGGAGNFLVTSQPLSLDPVIEAVADPSRGGVVTFSGAVRNQTKGRAVLKLEYEAYAPMAVKKLEQIAAEAVARWPGVTLAIHHRVGTLTPGELAVVIAAAAPHRTEAFRACEHAIERLKQDVPIWKKEHFTDGEVWVGLGP